MYYANIALGPDRTIGSFYIQGNCVNIDHYLCADDGGDDAAQDSVYRACLAGMQSFIRRTPGRLHINLYVHQLDLPARGAIDGFLHYPPGPVAVTALPAYRGLLVWISDAENKDSRAYDYFRHQLM